MPKPEAPKYRTSNWNAYNAALKSRGALLISIDKDRAWFAAKGGKRGRAQTFSNAAIPFCLSILCLFRLPLRQSIGMVEGLLRQAGLDWPVPDFSTVSRRQKTLTVVMPYRASREGLHLLVDSTGIKMLGEGEWKRKK